MLVAKVITILNEAIISVERTHLGPEIAPL